MTRSTADSPRPPDLERVPPTAPPAPDAGAPSDARLDDAIDPPRAMGPLLERLRLRVYRDLLDFSVEDLVGVGGVGRSKLARMRELVNAARRMAGLSPRYATEAAQTTPARLEPWPEDPLDPRVALGRIPTRALNVLDEHDLRTIRALRTWMAAVDVANVRNYGRKTHAALEALLLRLRDEGSERLVFGGAAPATLQALARAYLAQLEPDVRTLVEAKLVHGQTLEAIAGPRHVTRERVRQIIDKAIARDRPAWGARARELVEPGLRLLEAAGGVLPAARFFAALGDPPPWAFDLGLLLAPDLEARVDGAVATLFGGDELRQLYRTLRAGLGAALEESPGLSGPERVVAEAGLRVDPADLPVLLDRWLGIDVHGDLAEVPRRRVMAAYVHALHRAGGPLSAEELAARVAVSHPELEPSKRNATSIFARTPQVVSHSHGLWIHVDHLPFDREALDRAAQEVLPLVEDAAGQGVSAKRLLETLRLRGRAPEGLTDHMLRDALVRTGRVRGRRAGTHVAWKGDQVRFKSIADWIVEIAPELDQPFSTHELVDAVAEQGGFEPGSVLTQIGQTASLLSCGDGLHFSVESLFPEPARLGQIQALVHAQLPVDDLATAERLAQAHPTLAALAAAHGPALLWAIGRAHPEVRSRLRGHFLWRAALGDAFTPILWRPESEPPPVLTPARFGARLAARYGPALRPLRYQLLEEAEREGLLLRLGSGWYLDARLARQHQLAALAREPDLLQLAARSPAFVADSPARPLLEALTSDPAAVPARQARLDLDV